MPWERLCKAGAMPTPRSRRFFDPLAAACRNLVEAAGYLVIDDAENEKADVVIACLGEELPEQASHKTIWLRPEPEAASKKDFSIYRYDRAGLLMALKSAGGGRDK